MHLMPVDELTLFLRDGHYFVRAPHGRAEELLIHLASHGIGSAESSDPEFDCLRLKGSIDPETVQAVLDEWER